MLSEKNVDGINLSSVEIANEAHVTDRDLLSELGILWKPGWLAKLDSFYTEMSDSENIL